MVHVSPCNDPPVALNLSLATTSATVVGVALNATDVDSGTFVFATITSLPSAPGGTLLYWDTAEQEYLNVTSVPFDLNPYSSDWTSGPTSNGPQLMYAYYGDESLPLLDKFGTFVKDTFEFSATDSGGAASSPAVGKVDVRVPLVAASSSEGFVAANPLTDPNHKKYTVYEATMGNVSVFAQDLSDRKRSVAVRVVGLPKHGLLLDPNTGAEIVNGSLLTVPSVWPYEKPVLLTYLGKPRYFNSPLRRFNGSALTFEGDENDKGDQTQSTVAVSGGGEQFDDDDVDSHGGYGFADTFKFTTELFGDPAVFSQVARQAVVVVNVNGAPDLSGPPPGTVLYVQALGASSSTNNNQGGGSDDFFGDGSGGGGSGGGGGGDADTLVVNSIVLTDGDRDVDPIKVSLASFS
jgi:hypothetical protein